MDSNHHIVERVSKTPSRRTGRLDEADVKILDAWFWPVTEIAEPGAGKQDETVQVEVSLLPPTRRLLRDFPVPGLESPYLRHLEQRITRNPRDLLSHVRRLYLADALGDVDAITGALTDLFLVLGQQGRQLRGRLLKLTGDKLAAEQRQFFEKHLEGGLDSNEPIPQFTRSRLSKRVSGTTNIVSRVKADTSHSIGPVQLARESISKGHYDVAQAVLEGALESDPGNRDACTALLDLYSDRGLRRDFDKTYTTLLGRQLACRERWDDLARRFRLRVGTGE